MSPFECTECGQLGRFPGRQGAFEMACPNCEQRTRWERAFDEPDAGVEF